MQDKESGLVSKIGLKEGGNYMHEKETVGLSVRIFVRYKEADTFLGGYFCKKKKQTDWF